MENAGETVVLHLLLIVTNKPGILFWLEWLKLMIVVAKLLMFPILKLMGIKSGLLINFIHNSYH